MATQAPPPQQQRAPAATHTAPPQELLITWVSPTSPLHGRLQPFRDRLWGMSASSSADTKQSLEVCVVVFDRVLLRSRELVVLLEGRGGLGERAGEQGVARVLRVAEMLGVGGELVRVEDAEASFLRVTQVVENSPAEDASLEAGSDFVLYSLSFKYHNLKSFCDQVKEFCKQPKQGTGGDRKIKLAIYSLVYDQVRMVAISPYERWSPINGWLGAQFGDGIVDNFRNIQKQGIYKPISPTEKPALKNKILHENTILAKDVPPLPKPELRFLTVERVPQLPSINFLPLNRRLATKQVNLFDQVGITFEDMDSHQTYRITKEDLILLDRDFQDCQFGSAPKQALVGSKPSAPFDGLEQLTQENRKHVGAFTISVNNSNPKTITI